MFGPADYENTTGMISGIACSRLPDAAVVGKRKQLRGKSERGLGSRQGGAQAPTHFSHAFFFSFPTTWELGTGYFGEAFHIPDQNGGGQNKEPLLL